MTTGYMRSTLEPEHRLKTQDSTTYQNVLLDNKVDKKSERMGNEEGEDQLKKPRRKDTPILNTPPHIPGVRYLKAERQMIHLEDEEKDVKD